MADPAHTPELDGLDRLTVSLYRLSFLVGAGALGTLAWGTWWRDAWLSEVARWWVAMAAVLGAANLHLYVKGLRWFVPLLPPLGLLLTAGAPMLKDRPAEVLIAAGFALQLAAIGALCFKESFCFRVPGARLAPLLVAAAVVADAWRLPKATGALFGALAGIVAVLAVFKLLQPLGHDIGDRSRYQL